MRILSETSVDVIEKPEATCETVESGSVREDHVGAPEVSSGTSVDGDGVPADEKEAAQKLSDPLTNGGWKTVGA